MHFIVKKTFLECVPDHRDDVMSKTKSEPIKFKDGRTALNDISVGSRLHSSLGGRVGLWCFRNLDLVLSISGAC
eukprot:g16705.t1